MSYKEKLKKMDELHQHIVDGALLHELTNEEIASTLTSAMRTILTQDHNKARLKEMGIAKSNLDPNLVCTIQAIWTGEMVKTIQKSNE